MRPPRQPLLLLIGLVTLSSCVVTFSNASAKPPNNKDSSSIPSALLKPEARSASSIFPQESNSNDGPLVGVNFFPTARGSRSPPLTRERLRDYPGPSLATSPLEKGGDSCYIKWLRGYKLNQGLRVDRNITLEECKFECFRVKQCAAFAYGETGECELATRKSRSITNVTLDYADLEKRQTYDIYIEKEGCSIFSEFGAKSETSPAFSNGGLPVDCFYRLMSGKRLVKNHVLRAINVATLQECQESCVRERNFECRSVSYRYMPSGYTYNVANCELSNFYITDKLSGMRYDYIDDYDYDFFTRAPKCKTAENEGFGVCSVVSRRSTRLGTHAKSSNVNTLSQCEYLCATAFFSCRAFSFRTTERGRDRQSQLDFPNNCLLYDVPLTRTKDFVSDRDFDIYEIGSLVSGECRVEKEIGGGSFSEPGRGPPAEYHSRRPSGFDRDRDQPRERIPVSSGFELSQNRPTSGSYLPERFPPPPPPDRIRPGHNRLSPPTLLPPHLDHLDRDRRPFVIGSSGGSRPTGPGGPGGPPIPIGHGPYDGQDRGRERPRDRDRPFPPPLPPPRHPPSVYPPPGPPSHLPPSAPIIDGLPPHSLTAQDRQNECLVKLRQDYYISEKQARGTFPVKTLEECKSECLRSQQVLRFPCKALAFRLTSSAGGSCQLADVHLTTRDFVIAGERDKAVVYINEGDCGNAPPRGPPSGEYIRPESRYPGPSGPDRFRPDRPRPPLHPLDRIDRFPPQSRYPDEEFAPLPPRRPPPPPLLPPRDRYPPPRRPAGYLPERPERPERPESRFPEDAPSGYYPPTNPSDDRNRFPQEDTRFPYATRRPPTGNRYEIDRDFSRERDRDYPQRERYPADVRYPPQSNTASRYPASGQSGAVKRPKGPEVRHTVTGERCIQACRRNREAGFYYCIVDNQGSWDFCCRPDHFCGYSRGLSVPWCYVGEGPSAAIWRSCNLRLLKAQQSTTKKTSYLHEREPPAVLQISNDLLANLTKDNALQLLDEEEDLEDLDVSSVGGSTSPSSRRTSPLFISISKEQGSVTEYPRRPDLTSEDDLEPKASNRTEVVVKVSKSVSSSP